MARKLKTIYYVEPNSAALAARAAQYIVEMAEESVQARGRARIAISGGSTPKAAFQLIGDRISRGGCACHGNSSNCSGSMSGPFPPTIRKATTA